MYMRGFAGRMDVKRASWLGSERLLSLHGMRLDGATGRDSTELAEV